MVFIKFNNEKIDDEELGTNINNIISTLKQNNIMFSHLINPNVNVSVLLIPNDKNKVIAIVSVANTSITVIRLDIDFGIFKILSMGGNSLTKGYYAGIDVTRIKNTIIYNLYKDKYYDEEDSLCKNLKAKTL